MTGTRKRKAQIQATVRHVQTLIALGRWTDDTEDIRWSLTTLACTVRWQWRDRVSVFCLVNAARGVKKTQEENAQILTDRVDKWGNDGHWEPK